MPKTCYILKKFNADHTAIIERANEIIEEWQDQGYDLTLRQLYYQFISADYFPNTERSYKKLGGILNDARLAGLVDWDCIVDRTRQVRAVPTYDNGGQFLRTKINQYAQNHWRHQPVHIEVWVEKEALSQIVSRAANRYYADFLACKGYVSASAMYEGAQRFNEAYYDDKDCHLIYLGDHDPSGIDMTRDIEDRMDLFEQHIHVHRIALNRDQIDRYGPPPNPAKVTDSRANGYIAEHGTESWELDALSPSVLESLITEKIESLIDMDEWRAAQRKEQATIRRLQEVAREFE